jgi:hypothetical protein
VFSLSGSEIVCIVLHPELVGTLVLRSIDKTLELDNRLLRRRTEYNNKNKIQKVLEEFLFSSGIYEPVTRTVTSYLRDLRSCPAWGLAVITEF